MKALFVCTANVCRSPAAERLLELYGKAKGFQARSRGVMVEPYSKLDYRVEEFLRERGARWEGHKPSLVSEEDIDWADLVLPMSARHLGIIAELHPQAMRKMKLFLEAAGEAGDLEDPVSLGEEDFLRVMRRLDEAVKKIAGA